VPDKLFIFLLKKTRVSCDSLEEYFYVLTFKYKCMFARFDVCGNVCLWNGRNVLCLLSRDL